MTALMSTSLKVVSMAALCCASTSRRAMVARRLDMRSRCSDAGSRQVPGLRPEVPMGAGRCAAGVPARCLRRRGALARRTSPFVTRPPAPVAATASSFTPCFARDVARRWCGADFGCIGCDRCAGRCGHRCGRCGAVRG